MKINKNRIYADDEIDVNVDAPIDDVDVDVDTDDEDVSIDDAATELLFETEDVAQLISEVTDSPVDVTVEDNGEVKFAVGDAEFTVTPEGDEELLEASTRIRGRKPIRASRAARRPMARRPMVRRSAVRASTSAKRPVRRASKG